MSSEFEVDFTVKRSICFSGGAPGADQLFGQYAGEVNHEVNHFSFQGHNHDKKCDPDTIIELTQKQLNEADPLLKRAGQILSKNIGHNQYVKNLLRRNFYQVRKTDRVYAVSYIEWLRGGLPGGGAGWAITMAILNGLKDIYVFDQKKSKWFKFDQLHPYNSGQYMTWKEIIPPKPYGRYTGIGSRELTENGRKAIEELYS